MVQLRTYRGDFRPSSVECHHDARTLFAAILTALQRGDLAQVVGSDTRRVSHRDVDTLTPISHGDAQRSCRR